MEYERNPFSLLLEIHFNSHDVRHKQPLFLIIISYNYFTTLKRFSCNRFFINPHQFVSFSTINRIVTEYKEGVFKLGTFFKECSAIFEQITYFAFNFKNIIWCKISILSCQLLYKIHISNIKIIYRNQHFSILFNSCLKLKIKKGRKKKMLSSLFEIILISFIFSTRYIYESP